MRETKIGKRKNEFGIAVIFIAAVFVLMWSIRPWKKEISVALRAPEAAKVRRSIDGVWVEQGKANPPIAGVMIENMIEAQPLSGIADAVLVFEAVAEANITRFLAYFVLPSPAPHPRPLQQGEMENIGGSENGNIEIGPVRSARPYYLDWASEFNTWFAHVGSSPAAYDLLRKKGVEGVEDLDQWYKSEFYFGKEERRRPHHLYTSTELLGKAYNILKKQEIKNKKQEFDSWQFKNDAPPDLRANVIDITVGYVAPYIVRWQYDKSVNHYTRMQWNGTHKDANGKAIIAKNIAVAFMDMKVIDEIGRKEFKTIGEGNGLVFKDGRVVVGTWKKPSARHRIRWYDAQEQEVAFNAGTTWVEVVPVGWVVNY